MMKKSNKPANAVKKPTTSKPYTAMTPPPGGSVSHSVEKIDNGFLHRHSMHDGKGNFKSKTIFSPTAQMVPEPPSKLQSGSGTQKMTGGAQRLNKPMKLSAASKKPGATDMK